MFARWKERKRRRGMLRGNTAWYAVLVECHRREGKPCQHVVRYLGCTIKEYAGATAWQRAFWRIVDPQLDDLGLDPETRRRIEEKLTERVKRPTAEELEKLDRESLES
jgi:hypothetical protein